MMPSRNLTEPQRAQRRQRRQESRKLPVVKSHSPPTRPPSSRASAFSLAPCSSSCLPSAHWRLRTLSPFASWRLRVGLLPDLASMPRTRVCAAGSGLPYSVGALLAQWRIASPRGLTRPLAREHRGPARLGLTASRSQSSDSPVTLVPPRFLATMRSYRSRYWRALLVHDQSCFMPVSTSDFH